MFFFVTLCCRLQPFDCKFCKMRGKNTPKSKHTPQNVQMNTKSCTFIMNILNCFMDANLGKGGTQLQQNICKLLSQGRFSEGFVKFVNLVMWNAVILQCTDHWMWIVAAKLMRFMLFRAFHWGQTEEPSTSESQHFALIAIIITAGFNISRNQHHHW